jgi:glycosyltransferase involved in cell wall biosynthesis
MMPAHNAEPWIEQAIAAVQAQTYRNWQLVIVDDGSKDGTLARAREYSLTDGRIRIEAIEHGGCPVARNACLQLMTGDIFARQDADDLMTPDRLERSVQFLLDNPSYDLVSCGLAWLTGDNYQTRRTGPMIPKLYLAGKGGSPVCASLVAWRKCYDMVGRFDESMEAGSDGDWNFKALDHNLQFGYIASAMYIQRRHPDQLSQRLRHNQRKNHERSRNNRQLP